MHWSNSCHGKGILRRISGIVNTDIAREAYKDVEAGVHELLVRLKDSLLL
jgi:hypothetical protein